MSKTEIIQELAQLSPEDLADVRAWLDRVAPEKNTNSPPKPSPAAQIRSPRLANSAQSRDFAKQVMEGSTDAAL
jgi:hypothetical protein